MTVQRHNSNKTDFHLEKAFASAHLILVHMGSSSSEGPGESVHMRRLTIAFSARIHKVWMQMKTYKMIPLSLLDLATWNAFVHMPNSPALGHFI